MTMLHTKSAKKNEKGIALIFTLIMLSLLLILALSFTMDSMFSQKSAYNAANASSARFLAEAQLKQVLTLIKADETNFAASLSSASDRIFSYDGGSGDQDMLRERLTIPGVFGPTSVATDPCYTEIEWNYEENNEGHIIGRTAFILLSGLPINSLISTETADVDESGDDTANVYNEQRIGKDVSEINIRNAMYQMHSTDAPVTYTISPTMSDFFNWKAGARPDGEFTGVWSSFASIFDYVKIIGTASDDEKIIFKRNFAANFAIDAPKDKEAFWMNKNSPDVKIDDGELYRRFDITRQASDWDTDDNATDLVFMRDKILLTPDTNTPYGPTVAMEAWDNTDSDTNSVGLPWLACFGYNIAGTVDTTLGGTFGSDAAAVYNRRCQIAANLKDYCDNDDSDDNVHRPTSDVDPTIASATNWLNAEPTFTGNEKTPYINKIGFQIEANQQELENPALSGLYDIYTNISIVPCVELINIYGNNWSTESLTVVIEGSVTIETTVSSDKTKIFSNALDCTITIAPGDWVATGYSNLGMSAAIFTGSTQSNPHGGQVTGTAIDVKVKEINITKIVLHNGTIAYDYTKALEQSAAPLPFSVFSGNAGSGFSWFGFAAHDPRQNLNGTTFPATGTIADADWKPLTPSNIDDPTTVFSFVLNAGNYEGKPNAENSTNGGGDNTDTPDTTTGVDTETGLTDPVNLSTAFIRNAPMESPWELGFIHRGAKWQTINLKKYDLNKAFQKTTVLINGNDYIAGGGAYASGDANILDQIKMTATAKSPQKISLKSQKKETFDALLSRIELKPTIDATMSVASMAGGTVTNMATEAPTIAANIKTKYQSAVNPDQKRTRASIVDELLLPIGTILATTDAAQEELIGKIVNLTKVGSKTGNFTIIVLAQTIKDVGGDGVDISMTKYTADETSTEMKDCRIGQFDIQNGVYFDEITSEQKILVKGSFDGSTLKITSFQYID